MTDNLNKKHKTIVFLSLTIIILLIIIMPVCSCAKSEKKRYVIGFVNPNPGEKEGAQGFLRNMPAYGYIEGKNVTYIKCESRESKCIDDALKDMVAKKADLIFTMTTPAAKKAKQVTEGTNIPVVFVMYDAVQSGLVKSLINPGGNITGVQIGGSTPKTLEWLLAIAPDARHIFVPISFDTGAAHQSLADLKKSAAKLNIRVTVSEVGTVEELQASLSSMPKDVGAIFILHSWLIGSNLDVIINKTTKRKIPVISAGHVDFDDGVVMSYAPRDDRIGEQAARLAHGILHGTAPGDIPVETSDFFLGINLKTAISAGIKIPDNILLQADFIVR